MIRSCCISQLALVIVCAWSRVVLAQGTGDLNGNGLIGASDLAAYGACALSATSPTAPGCEAADQNGDGVVDAFDCLLLQQVVSAPTGPCTRWRDPGPVPGVTVLGQRYAKAEQVNLSFLGDPLTGIAGMRGYINTKPLRLCNNGYPGNTALAGISVWFGVGWIDPLVTQPIHSSELGYLGYRNSITPQGQPKPPFATFAEVFTDTAQANIPTFYRIHFFDPPDLYAGPYFYASQENPSNGAWTFVILDDFSVPVIPGLSDTITLPGWAGITGAWITAAAEMKNEEDKCPGTFSNPVVFSELQLLQQGTWYDVDYSPDEVEASGQYGAYLAAPNQLEVWDKRP